MGYRKYEAWTNPEIDELFRLRSNGDTFAEIGSKINRSAASAKSAFNRFKKDYPNCILPKKRMPEERHRREKYSMCWLCQNACVNCEKPVKGWNAKKLKMTVKGLCMWLENIRTTFLNHGWINTTAPIITKMPPKRR